ncbi:hypothetical protein ABZ464_30805 [Streptomyces sp. NPDC005820]
MKHILVLGARNLGGTIIDRFRADDITSQFKAALVGDLAGLYEQLAK